MIITLKIDLNYNKTDVIALFSKLYLIIINNLLFITTCKYFYNFWLHNTLIFDLFKYKKFQNIKSPIFL